MGIQRKGGREKGLWAWFWTDRESDGHGHSDYNCGVPPARRVHSFNNKSHDRHGNTEMLFLGLSLPSHGNGPRPPCERKYLLPSWMPHPVASWSCQMGADGAARKLPAAAHFNLII
ncbi:hypothetical protein M5D96_002398 [Drosophila gunungcola]|uniref:Uncharacterized protein n=1 Tax=Drosophila gunungcola TaxID=103775 RepID=A0A9P9Z0D9_9MUSC|nr:hypothetical protein M5D96_002398 [Drosophila gunungcola]